MPPLTVRSSDRTDSTGVAAAAGIAEVAASSFLQTAVAAVAAVALVVAGTVAASAVALVAVASSFR